MLLSSLNSEILLFLTLAFKLNSSLSAFAWSSTKRGSGFSVVILLHLLQHFQERLSLFRFYFLPQLLTHPNRFSTAAFEYTVASSFRFGFFRQCLFSESFRLKSALYVQPLQLMPFAVDHVRDAG